MVTTILLNSHKHIITMGTTMCKNLCSHKHSIIICNLALLLYYHYVLLYYTLVNGIQFCKFNFFTLPVKMNAWLIGRVLFMAAD